MTELPPNAQALLARAKESHRTVPSGAKQRVRAALVDITSEPPHERAQAGRRLGRLPISGKWLAGIGSGALALAVVLANSHGPRAPADSQRDRAQRPAPLIAQGSTLRGERAPTGPAPALEPRNTLQPTSVLPAAAISQNHGVVPATRLRHPHADDTLREETRLLQAAEAALRRTDLRAARAELRSHRRRFLHGQLRAEREGLLLLIACELAEPTARARALRERTRRPASALSARIERACALDGGAEP